MTPPAQRVADMGHLAVASAVCIAGKDLLGTFSANLVTLPGASGDATTMAWWTTQPQAWVACRTGPEDPAVATVRYKSWPDELPGRPVFVGYPAAFDFMFIGRP